MSFLQKLRKNEVDTYWENEEKRLKFLSKKLFFKKYDQAFSGTYFHGYNKKPSELNLLMGGFKVSRNGLKERASMRVRSAMARYSN